MHTLRIGQSADPDDAFMVWALATGRVRVPGFTPEIVFDGIQELNRRALEGELEATALSAAAYPAVAHRYRLLRCGASFGREHGPVVVGREAPDSPAPEAVAGLRVAVPGTLTTAYLLLRLGTREGFTPVPMAFHRILEAVVEGEVQAGLVIHEGQLTYREQGLSLLFEPGLAWHRETGLPVPLGVMAVRRDLGAEACQRVAEAFRASIAAARDHPGEALQFAARHGRGLAPELMETFVAQYVDEATWDMGQEGLEALRILYERALGAGLIEAVPELDPL